MCEVSVCLGRQVIGWVDMRRLEAGHIPKKCIYTTQITPYHTYIPLKPQSKSVSLPFLMGFGWCLGGGLGGCGVSVCLGGQVMVRLM